MKQNSSNLSSEPSDKRGSFHDQDSPALNQPIIQSNQNHNHKSSSSSSGVHRDMLKHIEDNGNQSHQHDQTDINLMNVTSVSNNNLVIHEEPFSNQKGHLEGQLSKKKSQVHEHTGNEYMSQGMQDLKIALENDNDQLFEAILRKDLLDSEEVFMYLYCAVACFNNEKVFSIMIQRNNNFKVTKAWYMLFSTPRIFSQLVGFRASIERRRFDSIAMKIAIERDFYFMVELILTRSLVTKELIQILLAENQKKLLVQQISQGKKPTYLDVDQYNSAGKHHRFTGEVERDLHFNDIVYASLDARERSQSIIDLVKLMKTEIDTKFFDHPSKEFNYVELFRMFAQRRKIKLIRYLFSLKDFQFTNQLFIEAIETEAYDIGALLYKEFFRKLKESKKDNEYIITILISSLNKNNGQLDFKAFLLKSFIEQFILRHAKHFLDTMDQKISQENKQNILTLNLNVVKCSCLLIELLETLGARFERLKVRCSTLRGKIELIGQKYMAAVESEQEMRYLLLEKDFENRDSLELINSYTISPFLESQFADNVVKEIWRSPYATNNSLFSASTNHKLTFQYWNCIKDDEQSSRFYHTKDLKSFEAHPLQFTVWRFSGKSRIIIEFFHTAILAGVLHYFIFEILQKTWEVYDVMDPFIKREEEFFNYVDKTKPEYKALEAQYKVSYDAMSDMAEEFYHKVMTVSYLSFLPLMFAFQHIFNIVYASINKRMINPYGFLNLLDLVIFSFYFSNIIITYVVNLQGTWTDYPFLSNETVGIIYTRNYYGNYISEDVLWILCLVSLYVRVFYFLRFNEFMGKFVGIVEKLLYDVILIFCFYIIELLFFSLIAELCFRRLNDYNTTQKAFKTLFYSSLGQFSFDEFKDSDYGEYFGLTYMIIFLVCNVGIVMHLFIAVITVLYDSFAKHSNVYQMLETLKLRSHSQADKEYSALVSFPPPLNVLHVLFAPILLTSRNPQAVNEVILCIAYIPAMFGALILFIVYNILLLPVSYVKLLFHKLVMIFVYSKSYRVSRADKFIVLIVFTFFGPFLLILNFIVDVRYFLRHLWMRDMNKTQHKTSDKQISAETLEKLYQYFKVKQEKVLPYKQIATEIRDQLGIIPLVGMIIHPGSLLNMSPEQEDDQLDLAQPKNSKSKTLNKKNLETMFSLIKEYTTIKQILERNSEFVKVPDTNQRVKTVDCKIIFSMLTDSFRHKAVLKVEDEDYIFIRRAHNVKSQKAVDKRRQYAMDTDGKEERVSGQMDSEGTREQRKRQRIIFKKLLFLNTKRMLEVFDYKTGEVETKKLMYAMKIERKDVDQGQGRLQKRVSIRPFGSINAPAYDMELGDIEEKVQEIGIITPQMTQSLMQMKSEIQVLINHLSSVQHQQKSSSDKEKTYQAKINGLMKDLNNLKEEKQNVKNRSNGIIDNYFYDKNENNKKKVVIDESPIRDLIVKEKLIQFQPAKNVEFKVENNFRSQKNQKVGQPSPQKSKIQETESDIPDVDDDDDE